MTAPSFDELEQTALGDPQIRANLTRFAGQWKKTRSDVLGEVDFERLRQTLKAVKDDVVAALPRFRDAFIAKATAAGATVHLARDAQEACAIVLRLARDRGITSAVKSKSMVTEEIHLNHALEDGGIEVVETDLGEWIIQLANEKPSHMVVPAIHKNRGQIGELFSRKLGREISREKIDEQVATARRELRTKFLLAGMGISGANALIAESGSVMIVTNEGNGRLVTSLPNLHVAVAGFDKLLPRFEDAMTLLRLLARSATGRPFTSYVTFFTGASRPGQELHIVLVDNGRTALEKDPDFRAALRCVRCAACANICPAYQVVGGHVFGHVYTGPIGLVLTPFHHGIDAIAGPQSLCMSCNACEKVCPVDIPLPRLILKVREMAVRAGGLPLAKRLGLLAWRHPGIADGLIRAAALVLGMFGDGRGHLRVGRQFFPLPAAQPFRDLWRRRTTEPVRLVSRVAGKTVAFFPGCISDRFFPEMAEAAVRVLEACGARVVFPPGQHCCGLPALNSGDPGSARRLALQTLAVLEEAPADYVVSHATSCVVSITQDYADLLRGDPALEQRVERLRPRVLDLASFLHRVAEPAPPVAGGAAKSTVTVHDPCQSVNCLGLRREVRELLSRLAGAEIREMEGSSTCCGFGGSFSFEHPEVSGHVAEAKLAAASAAAPIVVADNPGCIMHLRRQVRARGMSLRVLHFAELIASILQQSGTSGAPDF